MQRKSSKRIVSPEALAAARARAKEARELYKAKPDVERLLSPRERADAAPFYFELRGFVRQIREARLLAGLTLAEVAEKTGLAEETLCRLESGAVTNPTWKTLGTYAAAVGRGISLTVQPLPRKPLKPARSPLGRG